MRAAVLSEVGRPLGIEDLAEPTPGMGEVLLELVACGVCHTDLHVMKGEVAFPTPAVLGHEVSGIVAGVGPGVTNLALGDRVVSSFVMPCGYCRRCVRGQEDLCETFFSYNRLRGTLYDGTTRLYRRDGTAVAMYSMGGLAEACVAPATAVFKIPDSLALGDVATLGCSALTAYGAVRNVADVRPGDSVAVIATGGVGSSVIQLAALHGASEIIAVDVAADKLEAAGRLGATHLVDASGGDAAAQVLEITGGRGVDVAFEALGSAATFESSLAMVTDGGAAVIIGIAAAGIRGGVDLSRLARRKLRVLGSYGGRPRTDMPALISLVERGVLSPQAIVTRRYGLDEAAEAYDALARGEIVGRAVIDIAPER